MSTFYFIDVVLPIPIQKAFTYAITQEEASFLKKGMRVAVSFGSNSIYTAIVLEIHQNAPTLYEAKEIHQILDESPIVSEIQLKHWEWISSYYMCSLGEVFRAALPSALLLESETVVYKNQVFDDESLLNNEEFLIFEALQHQSQITIQQVSDILGKKKVMPVINQLIKKSVIYLREEIYEQYKPKLEKYVRLHSKYSDDQSLEKLLSELIDFMENHVFAVWDFMSLIKALQKNLTCVDVPWVPNENRLAGRLVNEIVLAEESDVDLNGDPKSHFELYLESMSQIGASTKIINDFISKIKNSKSYSNSIDKININPIVKEFMDFTFNIINTNKNHVIASVFTFGREDLIPDMFIEIVKKLSNSDEIEADNLVYYLERHIEIDADEHGPMALKMIEELCGDDKTKWKEAEIASKKALEMRIKLWNYIENKIN